MQGPSGSGKSTLLRGLARLVPHTGLLTLDGTAAEGMPAHEWRRRVTLLPSPAVPLAPTVRADLLLPFSLKTRRGTRPPDDATLRAELDGLGLGPIPLGRSTGELSQGQLLRVALLRAVLAGPEILLLDEPTANLDPASSALVAARVLMFVRGGGALVVAGHTPPWDEVERVFRIEGGRLQEGSR
ncbi:MAG: ATP-binding cassette domain-containing protein [Proteobacteria bacterium]|nr:ATP-binding cassette domain-containing protein [Pseudomonadota bacterium]